MKRIMLSLPEEMVKVLEYERKERYLETIPETVRVILSDYLRNKIR
jgi:metal-responsive CopG/Arc/MetJ family transcriptional regulator